MEKYKHCLICKHHKSNFRKGVYCGLDFQKPRFLDTCPSISFGPEFEEKLLKVNIEYFGIARKQTMTIIRFFLIFFLGGGLMLLGKFYILPEHPITYGGPIRIIGTGVFVLIVSLMIIGNFYEEYSTKKAKLKEFNHTLKLYNIDYDLKMKKISKAFHELEVEFDLKMNSEFFKFTKNKTGV
jgi:hypothetical protein